MKKLAIKSVGISFMGISLLIASMGVAQADAARTCSYEIYVKSNAMHARSTLVGTLNVRGRYATGLDAALGGLLDDDPRQAKQMASDMAGRCLNKAINRRPIPGRFRCVGEDLGTNTRRRDGSPFSTTTTTYRSPIAVGNIFQVKRHAMKAICNSTRRVRVYDVEIYTKRIIGGGTCNFGSPGTRTNKWHTFARRLSQSCTR